MNERLYQYAVLLQPTAEEARRGERTKIVIPPSDWLVAASEQEVQLKAAMAIPQEYKHCVDRLVVAVRPF